MENITTIPTSELKKDLADSQEDIIVCQFALMKDILTYSGGSVQKRLDENKEFVTVITAELKRRNELDT